MLYVLSEVLWIPVNLQQLFAQTHKYLTEPKTANLKVFADESSYVVSYIGLAMTHLILIRHLLALWCYVKCFLWFCFAKSGVGGQQLYKCKYSKPQFNF